MKTVKLGRHYCIFDDDTDISYLSVCVNPGGYKRILYGGGPHKGKAFARVILGLITRTDYADHINGNSLDCRRDNLRVATAQQNSFNAAKDKNKKSGLPKGVFKAGEYYRAVITYNYQKYTLGTFLTVEKAEAAYNKKAAEFHPEFAPHISRKDNG